MASQYPAKFTRAIEGGWLIAFRNFPEAFSPCEESENREEIAEGCLQAAVWGRKAYDLVPLPIPSEAQTDEILIVVPPGTATLAK